MAEEAREGAASLGEGTQGRGEQPEASSGNPGESFGLLLPVESLVCAAEDLVSNPSF